MDFLNKVNRLHYKLISLVTTHHKCTQIKLNIFLGSELKTKTHALDIKYQGERRAEGSVDAMQVRDWCILTQ